MKRVLPYSLGHLGCSILLYIVIFVMPEYHFGSSDDFGSYKFYDTNFFLFGIPLFVLANGFIRSFSVAAEAVIGRNMASKKVLGVNGKLGFLVLGLIASTLPLCLMFHVPSSNSWINVAWYSLFALFFFTGLSSYAVSYNALFFDLFKVDEDKKQVNALMSAFWALGVIIGSAYLPMVDIVSKKTSLPPHVTVVSLYTLTAAFFMLLPLKLWREIGGLKIRDKSGYLEALRTKAVKQFYLGEIFLQCGGAMMMGSYFYYVTEVAGLAKGTFSLVMPYILITSIVVIAVLSRRQKIENAPRALMMTTACAVTTTAFMLILPPLGVSGLPLIAVTGLLIGASNAAYTLQPTITLSQIMEEHVDSSVYYTLRSLSILFGSTTGIVVYTAIRTMSHAKGYEHYLPIALAAIVFYIISFVHLGKMTKAIGKK